jgi:hypothetical protein
MMGQLDKKQLEVVNQYINEFCIKCKNNLQFLEKFKKHVFDMEKGFDAGWGSDSKLNQFFFQYERNVLTSHLISLNHKKSGLHNI